MTIDITDHFYEQDKKRHDEFFAERVKIATTADSPGDQVYVTLPNSDSPARRESVDFWRVTVDADGEPRYPERGETGCLIYMDTGQTWLIF